MGAYAATGMQVGGTIGQAYGQYQAGQFNSKVDRFNAKIAQMQSDDALRRSGFEVNAIDQRAGQIQGAARAAQAANGVVVDQDSAKTVVDQTRIFADQDMQTAKTNAALEAWGFKVQAADSRARASMASAEGTGRAMGTVLTGGADTYRMGYQTGLWGQVQPKPTGGV